MQSDLSLCKFLMADPFVRSGLIPSRLAYLRLWVIVKLIPSRFLACFQSNRDPIGARLFLPVGGFLFQNSGGVAFRLLVAFGVE